MRTTAAIRSPAATGEATNTRDCKTSRRPLHSRAAISLALVDKFLCLRECVLEVFLANTKPCKFNLIRHRRQPRQPLAGHVGQADFTRSFGQKLARGPRKCRYVKFEFKKFAHDIDDFIEQRFDTS